MADEKIKQAPKKKVDSFTESLLPETDARLAKVSGVGLIIAVCLAVWFSTIELIVDDVAFEDVASEDLEASMQIEEKKEEKKEKKKEEAKKPRKKAGGGGKPRGKGNPKAPQSRGVLKMITTRTAKSGYSAYSMTGKMSKDIDKVLKNVAGLQISGKQVLGGRRGRADGGFNEGYAEGGSGGIGDMLGGLMGGGGGAISTQARGKIKPPSSKDIEMGSGGGSRSASEIMSVVRARTPGLRHVYNKFLKTKPGFSGKVTLKFTIAPGGEIISISVVSSTTGYAEFDQSISSKVKRWTFKKIKSGNTTVKIPFTFSE
jgi:TonB family protein